MSFVLLMSFVQYLLEPIACLSLGGILLIGMSFIRWGRHSGKTSRHSFWGWFFNSDEVDENRQKTEELLTTMEVRQQEILRLFTEKENKLQAQEDKLHQLITRASATADRLERMIECFEETFFARNKENPSISETFGDLKESLASEVANLRSNWNIDEQPSRIIKGASNESADSTVQYHVTNLCPAPSTVSTTTLEDKTTENVQEVKKPVFRNNHEKKDAVQRLLKQGISTSEIEYQLGLSTCEVDTIVKILKGQWKVA